MIRTLIPVAAGLTFSGWTAAQAFMDAPPVILDQAVMVAMGIAATMEYTSLKHMEKSPPPTEEATVARTPDQDRAEAFERAKAQSPAPDAPGVFYCQAGDHIIDTGIVWLETITLGCRPCMEKLGRDISRDDWTPRLWSVGPEGTRLAKPIPKPKPIVVTPARESWSPFAVNPFATQTKRRQREGFDTPVGYIRDKQDWSCARCGVTRDKMDGVYNTTEGFVCTNCHPTQKLGQAEETGRQRSRREANERTRKIVERQSDQINKAYDKAKAKAKMEDAVGEFQKSVDPLKQALQAIMFNQEVVPDHTKDLNWRIEDGMVVVDADEAIAASRVASAPIRKNGHNASVVIEGDVLGSQLVEVTGHNAEIKIRGDVGAEASVIATGHNASIKVGGHVHRYATVTANGHNAGISYGTRDETSYVQAEGMNATVKGKVGKKAVVPQDQQQARRDLAYEYGLEYDDSFIDSVLGQPNLEQPKASMYVCTCVRCGKRDVDSPVMGGTPALDADYKCTSCIRTLSLRRSGPRAWPKHRDTQLSMMHNLTTYQDKGKLPAKGTFGQWAYVVSTDQMYTWTSSGWTQVALPSAPKEPAPIVTPVHKHSWMEAWGESGRFCRECGARG